MSVNKGKIKLKSFFKILGNIISGVILLIVILALFSTILTRIKGKDPSIFGHKLYYVASGSMTPTIPVGSLVIVKEIDANKVENLDIITFKGVSNTVITHRVVEVSKDKHSFTTKGDANNSKDPFSVGSEKIIGKVVIKIPFMGYILQFLKSKYGVVAIIVVIIFMVILSIMPKEINKTRKI